MHPSLGFDIHDVLAFPKPMQEDTRFIGSMTLSLVPLLKISTQGLGFYLLDDHSIPAIWELMLVPRIRKFELSIVTPLDLWFMI